VLSSPLLTRILNVPSASLILATSYLKLSDEPVTNDPSELVVPSLLKIVPLPNVLSENGEGALESAAVVDPVAAVKAPDTTLVTNTLSPPCSK